MHSCINQKLAGKYMNVRANTPNNSMKNVQKKTLLTHRHSSSTFKKIIALKLLGHSSEKRGLRSSFLPCKMLQNLPYL